MKNRADFYLVGEEISDRPFHYAACGLDYVYLLNGVDKEIDPDYGEITTIRAMDDLHTAIGLHVIEKTTNISGKEFRFLRKTMGVTQEILADRLQVDVQTIANYEKSRGKSIPGASQQLMRVVFLLHCLPPDAKAKLIEAVIEASRSTTEDRMLRRERSRIVRDWHERGELAVACG